MYDALTTRYTFPCPVRGESHVRLSDFRVLERLPGALHPVVFRVRFSCGCGGEHVGLVSHGDLDWAPLGGRAGRFVNLMTGRVEQVEDEVGDLAARRIKAGEWPWSFFCFPEERPRPTFPSAFVLLAPGERPTRRAERIGVAVRCPACERVSVNLVSHEHVDVPFHNDPSVGVVEHLFPGDIGTTVEEFRATLWSASFDARRLLLE
jgi:hypothetical protein